MMRTKVKQVVVYYEDGSKSLFNLSQGSVMTSSTRVKGRVPGNPEAVTEVRQISIHGEVDLLGHRSVKSSDLPEALPENDEVANGIDD